MDAQAPPFDDFSFGTTVVRPRLREMLHDGMKIDIGNRAFDLLVTLVEARGSVLSKDRIMQRVWRNRIVEENALEGQISSLRRALGDDRTAILTVTGRGYQFVGELTTREPSPLAPGLPAVLPGVRDTPAI
jgi:DNA-binding winged helix-turn-helix (wHTH) protein